MALSFTPRPTPRPRKRSRPAADVDGEHSCLHKKKRRLRLFLITSRLSPQFSHPATNIVDRGSSKIAVWAKQRALGRNLLRKAAILNHIRLQSLLARDSTGGNEAASDQLQEEEREQLRMADLTLKYGTHDGHTRPVHSQGSPTSTRGRNRTPGSSPLSSPLSSPSTSPRLRPQDDAAGTSQYRSPNDAYSYPSPRSSSPRRSYLPLPPSPLGLSNYAAFDFEDEYSTPFADFDDNDDYGVTDSEEDALDHATNPYASPCPSDICRYSEDTLHPPLEPTHASLEHLGPDEPVVGDFDQIDKGADPVWPDAFVTKTSTVPRNAPSSMTFDTSSWTSSGSRSPNFTYADAPLSPNAMSPNFAPTTGFAASGGADALVIPRHQSTSPCTQETDRELEAERERQRRYMFMPFGG